MSEMVERVAMAMRTYRWSLICHGSPLTGERKWHIFGSEEGHWRDITLEVFDNEEDAQAFVNRMNARAAIEAMREPTRAMFEAADDACCYVSREAWTAMIDAALSSVEGE